MILKPNQEIWDSFDISFYSCGFLYVMIVPFKNIPFQIRWFAGQAGGMGQIPGSL